jgi:hypothetical protein
MIGGAGVMTPPPRMTISAGWKFHRIYEETRLHAIGGKRFLFVGVNLFDTQVGFLHHFVLLEFRGGIRKCDLAGL